MRRRKHPQAASVRARLLNRARETGQDFNLILIRYALERLLCRLSISGGPVPRDAPGIRCTEAACPSALYGGDGKLEAMATLGIANSRMKDFFDLWILSRHTDFEGDTLRRAIRATFDRRKTVLPPGVPFGMTDNFARDTQKQTQWQAILVKNSLEALELEVLVAVRRDFLLPPIAAANADNRFPQFTRGAESVTPALIMAAIAFSTGTSWGAFALMMPVAVPVAVSFSGGELSPRVYQTVAAIAGGGIFGDHASPASDTTVLASLGAGSDHMDHVITQLPYALAMAAVTLLLYLFL